MTERDYRTWEQVAKDYEAALHRLTPAAEQAMDHDFGWGTFPVLRDEVVKARAALRTDSNPDKVPGTGLHESEWLSQEDRAYADALVEAQRLRDRIEQLEAALREIARLIDLMPSLSDEGRSRLHSVIRAAPRTEGRDDG